MADAETEQLNALCPRVTPAHWEALERSNKALEKARTAIDEFDKLIKETDGHAGPEPVPNTD